MPSGLADSPPTPSLTIRWSAGASAFFLPSVASPEQEVLVGP